MAVTGELSHPNIVATLQCHIRPLLHSPPTASSWSGCVADNVAESSHPTVPPLLRMAKEQEWIDPFVGDASAGFGAFPGPVLKYTTTDCHHQPQPCELRLIMELCDGGCSSFM